MNEITRALVIETAMKHKAAAKRNDYEFHHLMKTAHWDHMVATFGVRFYFRFCHLLSLFRPEFFDKDGYIREFADFVFDLDREISLRVAGLIERKIAREHECQFTDDWGDLPRLTADPQLELFKMEA
jgi:hypothetical protein